MKAFTAWSIEVWDGAERHYPRYLVSNKEAADEWKSNNKHDLIVEKNMIIFDSIKELMDFKSGEIKRQALAKLSDVEKRALGF